MVGLAEAFGKEPMYFIAEINMRHLHAIMRARGNIMETLKKR